MSVPETTAVCRTAPITPSSAASCCYSLAHAHLAAELLLLLCLHAMAAAQGTCSPAAKQSSAAPPPSHLRLHVGASCHGPVGKHHGPHKRAALLTHTRQVALQDRAAKAGSSIDKNASSAHSAGCCSSSVAPASSAAGVASVTS
jgi:hypothetical protein